MSNAASLVDQAKEWAGHYGSFANGTEGAVLSVPLRFRGCWERGDADDLAGIFTENGSLLLGDEQLKGREEIRTYLTDQFAGPYRGTSVVDEPASVRFIAEGVAVAITRGGFTQPGETIPAPEREVRTTWVIVQRDGEWQLLAYQSSPITG
ncbi:hypothetical protein DSC45_34485 [Streptomyces sp. YIM 130001]|uniref:SgcJ/EcaC family oxidoreductase n=1 Tax=Streptomyces sp. YIM 130001 TaxID=2259644 RepID=UPI000E65B526|nr:SgcJ/EcaC family oxidoreductase [Streptomyces sp. YIM 130001]RII07936.1 hypothetical protein DSC45_34485 [Streptomyces sp. YIM 130001]